MPERAKAIAVARPIPGGVLVFGLCFLGLLGV
jgi:hypothetical protein